MSYSGLPVSGTTAQRPAVAAVGAEYFDTDLGKPVWWDGVQWVEWSAQTITIEFTNGISTYNPNAVAPKGLSVPLSVVTSDGLPTTQEVTVTVNVTGGTAVDPDDYTDESPYQVVIPAGTDNGDPNIVVEMQAVEPNAGIPPAVTIELTITAVINAALGAQTTHEVTLDTP